MCGITAISRAPKGGSSIPDARRFMRAALRAIEPRGEHATGAAWADPTGHPWYWKEAGPARSLAHRIPFPAGMRTTIGHTRHATLGSPRDNRNNHPIIGDGISLVHNGRIDNHADIIEATDHERVGQVDSEALLALISNRDAFGATSIGEVLALVEGVASLAWIDAADPHVLHLARCSTRPLTIARTRRDDLVMSSTPQTMMVTERLAQVPLFDIETIPEGTYLRVVEGQIVATESFPVRAPARVVPEDVARRNAVVIDGIDWGNLAPRRGWK